MQVFVKKKSYFKRVGTFFFVQNIDESGRNASDYFRTTFSKIEITHLILKIKNIFVLARKTCLKMLSTFFSDPVYGKSPSWVNCPHLQLRKERSCFLEILVLVRLVCGKIEES